MEMYPNWVLDDLEKYADQLKNNQFKLYTAEEFGNLFRVDKRTIYTWIKDGHLRGFYTPGRRLRIPSTEYLRLTLNPDLAPVND